MNISANINVQDEMMATEALEKEKEINLTKRMQVLSYKVCEQACAYISLYGKS